MENENSQIPHKVIIEYTVYLGENQLKDCLSYISVAHQDILNELGYELICNTYGVHRNANRLHLHYHTVNSIPPMKDKNGNLKKPVKGLNTKIQRLKSWKERTVPFKDFVEPEIHISTEYSNSDRYDEFKCLSYVMKEYATLKDMYDDIEPDACIGITNEELSTFRKQSNDIYVKSQKAKARLEQKRTKKQNLYEYLDNNINAEHYPDDLNEIDQVVYYTVNSILMYYEKFEISFSCSNLRNTAVNYLLFRGKITPPQICLYMNIHKNKMF